MGILRWLLALAWRDFSKIVLVVGWAMSFAIPAWAASAVAYLQQWAPLSWVGAGFAGALLAAFSYAAIARGRLWFAGAQATSEFYKKNDRVNPLDETFRNQRINLADLVPPFEAIVRRKTFIDCELIGPANVALGATTPGSGSMNGVSLIDCSACKVKDNVAVHNAIMLEDCTFLRGKIFRVTIFVPVAGYEHIRRSMPMIQWLTPD